ncbi:MAG: AAA family ATPase [Chloroflexi bacterium]|nr:AAA family ATPase [Chloroflexota bacterium]
MTERDTGNILRVARSSVEYASSCKCLCYLHADDLRARQIEVDDLISIETDGGRSTVARVAQPRPEDRQPGLIHLDRFLRQAIKVRLGEEVRLTKIPEKQVKKINLLPSIDVFTAHHLDTHLLETLVESRTPVTMGSVLYIRFHDSVAGTTYKVVDLKDGPGVITAETDVHLEYNENLHTDAVTDVTFDDVGGMQRQLDAVRELLQLPLQMPEVYRQLGINSPRGVILHGPPGVGKTHLARALANEVQARFYYINGPEVVGTMYGETESNLRRVFNEATHHAPSVILIDELDSIAPRRGESGAQSDTRMVTQLLSLMDGLNRVDGIIVLGTTNRLEAIDVAARRPGRFDREIFVGPPDADGRQEILEIHSREMPLADEAIDFIPEVARLTPGFVGADLMEICREAGLASLRRYSGGKLGHKWKGLSVAPENLWVTRTDFEVALTKIQPSAIREVLVTVPDVGWKDIGGLEEVKAELQRLVSLPLMRRHQFKSMKMSPSSGILIYGPSGCGKTLLAKAVAHECGVNFIAVEGPEIFTKWLGESEEMIRRIFRVARQLSPTIIFFDQLDAIAPRRGGDLGTKTTERVVNQLLAELDGIEALGDVVVIAATNRVELVDESMLRPGRFGTHLYVPMPDEAARAAIARIQMAGVNLARQDEIEDIVQAVVRSTVGFSAAKVKALCDEAKLRAIENSDADKTPALTLAQVQVVLNHYDSGHRTADDEAEYVTGAKRN